MSKSYIGFAILLSFLLSNCKRNPMTCKMLLKYEIKPLEIKGMIKEKYIDPRDRNAKLKILSDKGWQIFVAYDCYAEHLWKYCLPGDSIFKEKDTYFIKIQKKTEVKEFDLFKEQQQNINRTFS